MSEISLSSRRESMVRNLTVGGDVVRVILACMKKDLKSAAHERVFTVLGVFVPVNFLILMSLFVLAGSNAPTVVVMQEHGCYARLFYTAMSRVHSFRLQQADALEAERLLQAGQVVAVVTIPADFDRSLEQNKSVQIAVKINNLNTILIDINLREKVYVLYS